MKRFFAGLGVLIGGLMCLISGGCSLFIVVAGHTDNQLMGLVALVGGIPFLIGYGLWHFSLIAWKNTNPPESGQNPFESDKK